MDTSKNKLDNNYNEYDTQRVKSIEIRYKINQAIDNILRDKPNILKESTENNYDAGRYDAYNIVLSWLDKLEE